MKTRKASLAWSVLAIVTLVSLVLAACGPTPAAPTEAPPPTEAPTAAPTKAPEVKFKVGMVSDVGGIDDASFNENTWKGLQDAQEQLGVEAKFLESQAQADYENNITEFAEQGYNMIITVGFLLGDATYKMAAQYPDVQFAIVDFPSGGEETPNVQGILFNVHEASFPVGYVAAAMADQLDPDDPVVAYIGGMQIPPVEEFIVAYEAGVMHYNKQYDKDVQFTGVYVGDFEAPDQGKLQANSLIDEGADIIMGVGGKTGNGGIAAAKERGKWGVGVDVDQYYTLPNEKDILVTSTIKRLDKAVFSVIKSALEAKFEGGTNYIATLDNEGVGVGPFHDFEDKVPDEIKADLEQIQKDIIAKKLWTGWGEPPEAVAVAEGAPYKIGFNSSATGTYASLGLPEAKTAEMIQEQINAAGGVVGPDGVQHDVEIVIYDDENEADKTVSNVSRLILEDEVIVVVSTTGSGTSIAEIPVCEENETGCISMASAKPITTNPETGEEYKWMFKTPQTNGHAGEWQADYLKAIGVSKVCILYTDDGYGKDCLGNFKAAAEAAGLEVVYEAGYAKTDTEFSAQVAGAEASGCEAVEIGSTPAVASLATIAVRMAMPDIPITLGHGVCNKAHIDTAGEAAEGTVFPCGKITVLDKVPEGDPQKAVLAKYIEDYTAFTDGEPISTFGGHAWDGLMMAMEALGSLNEGMTLEEQRAAVRDYLENNIKDWPGISGTFTFSADDHNGLTKESLVFVKVVNGEWAAFPESEW